jgi:two-component system, NtrC family, response regulator
LKNILLVDDEKKLRGLLSRILNKEAFHVIEADDSKSAMKKLESVDDIEVVICDVKLPDGNGVELTKKIRDKYPMIEVILLTAFGNIQDGVQAMKFGAFDYLIKGDENEKIIPVLNRALEKTAFQRRIIELEKKLGNKYSFQSVIGNSKPILQAIELAKKVAVTDTTVLLLGETGTGKEVFANAIHQFSHRSSHPFVAINCSAFSKELFENELFGHKAGAFTSAHQDSKGLIEQADQGTLFLDEIAEMPIEVQPKLLRVLESGEFNRVGDNQSQKVNVRIITATNRDPEMEIRAGKFREDLFYRLSVFRIVMPSLRDRIKDIRPLAEYFVKQFSVKLNKPDLKISEEFFSVLEKHPWKGNIRELRNVVERAVIVEESGELTKNSLSVEMMAGISWPSDSFSQFDLAGVEKNHIQKVLQYTRGNKTESARLLNIGLTTLYRKIEEYQLAEQ